MWKKRTSARVLLLFLFLKMRRYAFVPNSPMLIIKTFGRAIGYQYLSQHVRELWKPSRNMDLVDLGHDYFLAQFWIREDLDNVLKGGLWFISQHFLAIKPWELKFSASEADLSQVAVWVRLLGLPIEFYELEVLKKIRSAKGPVLCINSHTMANARGRYARLCVQVRIDKPLVTTVLLGKFTQKFMYEGI